MATGALDSNGIWQYGEDDSNTTFSALLNRLGSSTSTQIAALTNSGRILQVVTNKTVGSWNTTSTSWASTGLTATITPKSSTSKIIIVVTSGAYIGVAGRDCFWTIFRGTTSGTNLGDTTTDRGLGLLYSGSGDQASALSSSITDTPATTSLLTYTFAAKVNTGGNVYIPIHNTAKVMTLIEVAG